MNLKAVLPLLACSTLLLTACGGSSSSSSGGSTGGDQQPPNTATLAASLTDAPACGYDAVNVTVNKISVHTNGSPAVSDNDPGWVDIKLSPAKKINLANLTNGALAALGQAWLPPGHYAQARLVLTPNSSTPLANSVVPSGSSTEIALDTLDWHSQGGIHLNTDFTVAAGQRFDLVLDFDACKSVLTNGAGAYALRPSLKAVPGDMNGISGFVSQSLLSDNIIVTAQQNGVVVAATVPNSSGEFDLTRLPLGNYDVVLTSNSHAAYVVGGVPVTSTSSMVPISTRTAPFMMQTSSLTGTISGGAHLQTAGGVQSARLAAKQTIAGGPTVAIREASADLANTNYSMKYMPLVAPLYAAYSSNLPLNFAVVNSTPGSGKYLVEASGTGYTTRSLVADISNSDATNVSFTLTP